LARRLQINFFGSGSLILTQVRKGEIETRQCLDCSLLGSSGRSYENFFQFDRLVDFLATSLFYFATSKLNRCLKTKHPFRGAHPRNFSVQKNFGRFELASFPSKVVFGSRGLIFLLKTTYLLHSLTQMPFELVPTFLVVARRL